MSEPELLVCPIAERFVLRAATPAERDALAGLDRLTIAPHDRHTARDQQWTVRNNRDSRREVGLVVAVRTLRPIRERARRAALDHGDPLREHVGALALSDHFPHVGGLRAAETGVHADRAVVAYDHASAFVGLRPVGVRARGNVVGDEALTGMGAVAEWLPRRRPAT